MSLVKVSKTSHVSDILGHDVVEVEGLFSIDIVSRAWVQITKGRALGAGDFIRRLFELNWEKFAPERRFWGKSLALKGAKQGCESDLTHDGVTQALSSLG